VGEGGDGDVVAIIGGGVGEADLIQGVAVEILFRGDKRRVRSKKACRDKKGFGTVFRHHTNCLGRNHAVGLLFVCACGGEPA
jgi:hypothetical protein